MLTLFCRVHLGKNNNQNQIISITIHFTDIFLIFYTRVSHGCLFDLETSSHKNGATGTCDDSFRRSNVMIMVSIMFTLRTPIKGGGFPTFIHFK